MGEISKINNFPIIKATNLIYDPKSNQMVLKEGSELELCNMQIGPLATSVQYTTNPINSELCAAILEKANSEVGEDSAQEIQNEAELLPEQTQATEKKQDIPEDIQTDTKENEPTSTNAENKTVENSETSTQQPDYKPIESQFVVVQNGEYYIDVSNVNINIKEYLNRILDNCYEISPEDKNYEPLLNYILNKNGSIDAILKTGKIILPPVNITELAENSAIAGQQEVSTIPEGKTDAQISKMAVLKNSLDKNIALENKYNPENGELTVSFKTKTGKDVKVIYDTDGNIKKIENADSDVLRYIILKDEPDKIEAIKENILDNKGFSKTDYFNGSFGSIEFGSDGSVTINNFKKPIQIVSNDTTATTAGEQAESQWDFMNTADGKIYNPAQETSADKTISDTTVNDKSEASGAENTEPAQLYYEPEGNQYLSNAKYISNPCEIIWSNRNEPVIKLSNGVTIIVSLKRGKDDKIVGSNIKSIVLENGKKYSNPDVLYSTTKYMGISLEEFFSATDEQGNKLYSAEIKPDFPNILEQIVNPQSLNHNTGKVTIIKKGQDGFSYTYKIDKYTTLLNPALNGLITVKTDNGKNVPSKIASASLNNCLDEAAIQSILMNINKLNNTNFNSLEELSGTFDIKYNNGSLFKKDSVEIIYYSDNKQEIPLKFEKNGDSWKKV